jgi:hypothetical protein
LRNEATQRARSVFGEILGSDTPKGNMGDQLLNSARALRRR